MKVLHIAPSYYPATYWGGPIFSVRALNNALARLPDVELRVLTTDAAGPRRDQALPRVLPRTDYPNQEIVVTPRVLGASISPELLTRLPSEIRWADVVHVTAAYSFPTIPVLALCRTLGRPLVWSPRGAILDAHAWTGTRKRGLKRAWERVCNMLIREGQVVLHVTSDDERDVTQARIPRGSTVLIPNGVEVPTEVPARRWRPDGLRLLFIGRLSPKKGIEQLLRALALDFDATRLALCGTGEKAYVAELKALARQLGLLERGVTFVGHVDGAAKAAAFESADVCVVPSFTENFGMVVAEALAHGVPVIASRGTPWREVELRGCGLWVDNSPEVLRDAIERMKSLDLLAMGSRGRAWMLESFSWDSRARAMIDVYQRLMEPIS